MAVPFFERPTDEVACDLLGAVLTHDGVSIRITEVEAYLGADDEASHAFRGPTRSNAALFGPAGHMYVYHSYGIHKAGNIVAHPPGRSGGVLLRAGEVVSGIELASQRRTLDPAKPIVPAKLASGPGNFGKAMGLDISDNGRPVSLLPGAEFSLALTPERPTIVCGPRIGISKNVAAHLRFWLPRDPTVSARKTWAATI
ncbi:DNA-3-methyladenine glycosylase [Corynebacterium epidermidicanis]|uniref:Putative 3-methyladenine DNA glycosylase n=1 Tax=Corynebacterium epidermidicanis TaxID=1050174 RepID=A0A0G3GRG0_9CORY|nr:DNA-3-methyladenine glycosylase [Corynebacterium epidermidicanis]AKK02118.1 DNA-3-methyladenine glycosylase [Corynebacterium epidermidicanis]